MCGIFGLTKRRALTTAQVSILYLNNLRLKTRPTSQDFQGDYQDAFNKIGNLGRRLRNTNPSLSSAQSSPYYIQSFLIILHEYLRLTTNHTFRTQEKKMYNGFSQLQVKTMREVPPTGTLKTLAKFLVSYFLLPRRTLCFSRFSMSVSPSQCVRMKTHNSRCSSFIFQISSARSLILVNACVKNTFILFLHSPLQ
jgi:hypothetical protein